MADDLTLLVDSSSLIYRAYFSMPDTVRSPDGRRINAAYGFLEMLARLVDDYDPDFICCAADTNWRPEWRVELIETYKAHRTEEGSIQQTTDVEVDKQLPVIVDLLARCGIKFMGYTDHEAEDVIGTLAARAPGPVAIVSGDRDLFQLVRDPDVWVLYPKRGVSVVDRVDEAYIEGRYGVPGRTYRDFSILRGDPSDGLPGVRGIGEKLAASLIVKYGSLDAVVAAAEAQESGTLLTKVRRDLDYLGRAIKVVTIPTDLPLPDEDLTRPRAAPDASVQSEAERHGLGNVMGRLIKSLTSAG